MQIQKILDFLQISKENVANINALYEKGLESFQESQKTSNIDTRLFAICEALRKKEAEKPYSINMVSLVGADENAHSRILVHLLKYRGENNTYPFAVSFVKEFIGEEVAGKIPNHEEKLEIYQEKERMDVQIFMRGKWGIIIENKIMGAADRADQVSGYIKKMQAKIPVSDPYVIYLTWDGTKKISSDSLSDTDRKKMEDNGHFIELNYRFKLLPWLKEQVLPRFPYKEKQCIFALEQYIDHLEERAFIRPQDQALNQAVWQAFCEHFGKEENENDRTI